MESYFSHRAPLGTPPPAHAPEAGGFRSYHTLFGGAPTMVEEHPVAMPTASDAPQIEMLQDEGRVTRIVVTCRCCERIELECEY